ncbi:MAG TPA: hypothetical protein ENH03_03765, partial [Candidatus Bathyarchaeota archaeon]|nr:hypothetical protein [Candidatus Bathyarchaeota archaeon]
MRLYGGSEYKAYILNCSSLRFNNWWRLNRLVSNVKLYSPNGNVGVEVSIRERLEPYPSGNRLYYSVSFRGKEIIVDSPLGLDFRDMPPLARDLNIVDQEKRIINEIWENPFGKSRK